jgi:F-type H+-transporting ATPase subunit c
MTDLAHIGGGLGAALIIIGAAYGISRLGATALDGGARQPEVAGHLRISMIIAAALIEGLGFFGLVICLILAMKPVAAEAVVDQNHDKAAETAPEHPGPGK